LDDRTNALRWRGMIEEYKIESLELLTDDDNRLLLERTVAYRPFPALKLLRDSLMALRARRPTADIWDYI
jgi:hypothetical protein